MNKEENENLTCTVKCKAMLHTMAITDIKKDFKRSKRREAIHEDSLRIDDR